MKTKIMSLALCAAFVVSLLAGCSGSGGRSGGGITVSFSNESSYVFNEIYLSPNESDEWGSDLLGGTNILKSGGTHEITLASASNGLYDILAIDEDGDSWQFERVPLEKDSTVVIYADGTAVSTSPDGTETTVNGELTYADEGYDDYQEQGADDQNDDTTDEMSDWIDMTFHNDSSYDFEEIYIFEEGITDDNLIGYNHIEEHGTLISMGATGASVEPYEYYDLILVDDVEDGWYFQSVFLEDGCDIHIYINDESDPTLEVYYADDFGTSLYFGTYM